MKKTIAIILAAGESTRFKSKTSKMLYELSGRTIIERVVDIVFDKFKKTIVVVGYKAEDVKRSIQADKRYKNIIFVEQKKQLGSGDAVKKAVLLGGLKNFHGDILVLCGDVPLLKAGTIKNLLGVHKKQNAVCTVLTCEFKDPSGYGRVVKSGGIVKSIIEEKDASNNVRKIKEVNSGVYVFKSAELFESLKKVKPDNAKREYYLTEVISILSRQNKKIIAYKINESKEIMGINNRYELAVAEDFLRKNILKNLMLSGITVVDPATTCIDESVVMGKDTTVMPSTIIKGKTKIKGDCIIGPFSYIEDCSVGQNVEIRASFVYGAEILDDVKIGPFSHIRRETKICNKARIGNFSEIKKSYIGKNTKVSHLSYIGDSHLGKNINIGAGTITCNYDGKLKHKTLIGDGTFIGSNTNLIAPIKIGRGVLIAAGSTITEDVSDKMLAVARARQVVKKLKIKDQKLNTHI